MVLSIAAPAAGDLASLAEYILTQYIVTRAKLWGGQSWLPPAFKPALGGLRQAVAECDLAHSSKEAA
jgi:hypothetical protein